MIKECIETKNGITYISYDLGNVEVLFFTAENNINFLSGSYEGQENLKIVKNIFHLENLGYLKQYHSNVILEYSGYVQEGDGIFTREKRVGVGVFTADCVPIIVVDEGIGAVMAIHSGWKGTLNGITEEGIDIFKTKYGSELNNLKVYIGPHNRECCYEIGEDVRQLYLNKYNSEEGIFNGNKLSMENIIIEQCVNLGVLRENIISLGLCTYCSDGVKLHSYRKNKEANGRLFSMAYLK